MSAFLIECPHISLFLAAEDAAVNKTMSVMSAIEKMRVHEVISGHLYREGRRNRKLGRRGRQGRG